MYQPTSNPKMTDKQNCLLTQLAYVNYNVDSLPGGIKFSNLKIYVDNPGDLDLISQLEYYGLGSCEVIAIERSLTGAFAIVFRNSLSNTVELSFCGTENDSVREFIIDCITNLSEVFLSTSPQALWAQAVYSKYRPTVIYGHSLGANLAEHVFLQNHVDIYKVFVINHFPIDGKTIDSAGQLAFNSYKFQCCVIVGDFISPLRSAISPVTYVKYSGSGSPHSICGASWNSDGSFVTVSELEALKKNMVVKVLRQVTDFYNKNAVPRYNLAVNAIKKLIQ